MKCSGTTANLLRTRLCDGGLVPKGVMSISCVGEAKGLKKSLGVVTLGGLGFEAREGE